jgi:hypothetical protein
MIFERVSYQTLNSRQQEAYNFQKVSAVLANYGYVTIRLTNDWCGADFIAQHLDGHFLKVQLKGRASFDKKYCNHDLYICFFDCGVWYLYPHDSLLDKILVETRLLKGTESWDSHGTYHFPKLPKHLKTLLEPYRLGVE